MGSKKQTAKDRKTVAVKDLAPKSSKEVKGGSKPIEGVGTSIAAFLGR